MGLELLTVLPVLMSKLQLFSKTLSVRVVHSSLFFFFLAGHLTSATRQLEAPTSAEEGTLRINAAENEVKLYKQVAMPHKERSESTTRAADKVSEQL